MGYYSIWRKERPAWTWKRLGPLEEAFWNASPTALTSAALRPVLAQAARELLLAQASDWQFIISTGAVVDYAERRFTLHCDDAERLVKLMGGVGGSEPEAGPRPADAGARRRAP